MASRDQIQMDFSRAQSQAGELEQIAESLDRLSNRDFPDTLDDLSRDWKGDNATKYIQKGYQLKESMADTARDLRNAAGSIRSIAQKIYDAEMTALRIAEEREEAARRAEEARRASEAAQRAVQSGTTGSGRRR